MTNRIVSPLILGLLVFACSGTDSSSSSSGGTTESKCRARKTQNGAIVLEAGCVCGASDNPTAPNYPKICSRASLGGNTICCKTSNWCTCTPAQCGTTVNDFCACGTEVPFRSARETCTETAPECCEQGTGYCYCEAGCSKRFASVPVGATCSPESAPLRCPSVATEVASCD
jgi:hypothetical protein